MRFFWHSLTLGDVQLPTAVVGRFGPSIDLIPVTKQNLVVIYVFFFFLWISPHRLWKNVVDWWGTPPAGGGKGRGMLRFLPQLLPILWNTFLSLGWKQLVKRNRVAATRMCVTLEFIDDNWSLGRHRWRLYASNGDWNVDLICVLLTNAGRVCWAPTLELIELSFLYCSFTAARHSSRSENYHLFISRVIDHSKFVDHSIFLPFFYKSMVWKIPNNWPKWFKFCCELSES